MAGKSGTRKGAYYLSGWKRIRLSVGKDAADGGARRQRKESELNALNNGAIVVPETGDSRHQCASFSLLAPTVFLLDLRDSEIDFALFVSFLFALSFDPLSRLVRTPQCLPVLLSFARRD